VLVSCLPACMTASLLKARVLLKERAMLLNQDAWAGGHCRQMGGNCAFLMCDVDTLDHTCSAAARYIGRPLNRHHNLAGAPSLSNQIPCQRRGPAAATSHDSPPAQPASKLPESGCSDLDLLPQATDGRPHRHGRASAASMKGANMSDIARPRASHSEIFECAIVCCVHVRLLMYQVQSEL